MKLTLIIRPLQAMLSILSLSLFLLASCSTGEKDPAKSVLLDSVKAMGGMSKATGWRTLVQKGTMTSEWPGWGTVKADCTYYTQKPDMQLLDQDYSAYDHPFYFVYVQNGAQAWSEVNMGIRQNERTTAMLEQRMREIDGLAHFVSSSDSFFIVPDAPADSLLAGMELTRIGCVSGDKTVYFDIDRATRLPAGKIETSGEVETRTIMEDYRDAGGRKVPFHVTVYQNGAKTNEFIWEEIVFDTQIDPAIFEKNKPQPAKEA